ncbi:MlaE family ABC transporter permease [Saprospira sp. CCB-QB6]|uniref:MlaE family ABC transporter permease n=1 Tax=Saprospira sp. CCB-QB6 TaxID=3023936 RepID=UPI003FA7C98D
MFYHLGRYFILMKSMFAKPERFSMYWKATARQMNDIGVGSLIIVGLVSVFIGAVTAVQFAYQLQASSIPPYYVGYIVRDIMIIELAPTFSCLALAGKVGSNIAAEIGGMRQKEQIDALEVMGVDTAAYLVAPKIIAAVVVIPMLVILSAFMGMAGGYLACVIGQLVTVSEFMQGLRSFFIPYNVFMMEVKAFVFAFLLTSISCYQGYFVKGGSIELGKASTSAVVISNIMILLADYVIALLMT